MKAKINSVILCNITQQLTRGRPLWAMARLNEYLEVSDPLRKALGVKAINLLNKEISPEIVQKLVKDGCLYNELSNDQQDELLVKEPAISTAPVKFTLANRLSRNKKFNNATKKTFIRARYASV